MGMGGWKGIVGTDQTGEPEKERGWAPDDGDGLVKAGLFVNWKSNGHDQIQRVLGDKAKGRLGKEGEDAVCL